MKRERAETLALEGVAFLAERETAMERFLQASGLQPAELRARLDDPVLLAAVCAFLLGSDDFVLDFCRLYDCRPEDLHRARYVLDRTCPE